jgi:hypothetical protein
MQSSATSAPQPVRLAHIVTHPILYFAPLYRELSSRPEVEPTVFFASDFRIRAYEIRGSVARLPGTHHRWAPTEFGARSREIIDEYSVEPCADGIVAACQALAHR